MSTELIILSELAKVTAIQSECDAIAAIVDQHIGNAEFVGPFHRMIDEINECFRFVEEKFAPFIALSTQREFDEFFDTLSASYQKSYLSEVSKPRHMADRAFELSIVVMQRKEFKTSYPLLKRTFDRLDYLLDKYVTNDAWLVMSIDSMLRRMSRFLNEVAELKKFDGEESFLTYHTLMLGIGRYLTLLSELKASGLSRVA